MPNLTISLNADDQARLAEICLRLNMTPYAFTREALLREMRTQEEKAPGGHEVSAKVLRLLELLKTRKWSLYQWQDFSDENHRKWLMSRDLAATKQEVKEVVALFRAQEVGKKDGSIAAYKAAHKVDE